MKNTKKLAVAGMLIAIGIIGGAWSIPVGASRCAPIQHMINILSGAILGPYYGVLMAFVISLIRVMAGTGTLLAFPGSMCGALLAGVMFKLFGKTKFATVFLVLGELVGTAIIGGILAYPVATLLLGKEAAVFTYVIPFFVSTAGGSLIGTIIYLALKKTKVLEKI